MTWGGSLGSSFYTRVGAGACQRSAVLALQPLQLISTGVPAINIYGDKLRFLPHLREFEMAV